MEYLSALLRRDGSLLCARIDESAIFEEYARARAWRNDFLSGEEEDDIRCVIGWLENKLDDGNGRRYVPWEEACRDGVSVYCHGRSAEITAREVAERYG